MKSRILPRLKDFSPDLIVISAGFDAHRNDPLGGLSLDEKDFAWITGELMEIAATTANGRIVSVLEGGYDLVGLARSVAARLGIPLHRGVYAAVTGPSYETAAEVRMLRRMGADVIGMSTVPEAITARALGMRCLGFSMVTNKGTGLSAEALSHEEVVAVGREAGRSLPRLLGELLGQLAGPHSVGAK